MTTGFLLIDKPVDWTSHDVVAYIRGFLKRNKLTDVKRPKVGHAGTLDPFATGLLIVGIGRNATKRIDEFKHMPKEYIATIRLGAVSDTYDRTGTMSDQRAVASDQISETRIREVLQGFIGKQQQLPPMYSAKKVEGKKLYELARKGIEIEREPCEIEIFDTELLEMKGQLLTVKCHVSSGTYIRTLAHDIGQALGTGAYCEELRRTKIGEYSVEQAQQLDALDLTALIP